FSPRSFAAGWLSVSCVSGRSRNSSRIVESRLAEITQIDRVNDFTRLAITFPKRVDAVRTETACEASLFDFAVRQSRDALVFPASQDRFDQAEIFVTSFHERSLLPQQ